MSIGRSLHDVDELTPKHGQKRGAAGWQAGRQTSSILHEDFQLRFYRTETESESESESETETEPNVFLRD